LNEQYDQHSIETEFAVVVTTY